MPCGRSRGGKAPANAQFSPVWQKEDFQPRNSRNPRQNTSKQFHFRIILPSAISR